VEGAVAVKEPTVLGMDERACTHHRQH
jgi:hypothetical protein